MKFPPCLVTTGWERKQGIRRSQLEGANSWSCPKIKATPYLFSYFFLVQNKPLCTFGQILAPWDPLVKTSFIWLYWIGSRVRECALIMADIHIDRFADTDTLVCWLGANAKQDFGGGLGWTSSIEIVDTMQKSSYTMESILTATIILTLFQPY